jgi:hypothetical protein
MRTELSLPARPHGFSSVPALQAGIRIPFSRWTWNESSSKTIEADQIQDYGGFNTKGELG